MLGIQGKVREDMLSAQLRIGTLCEALTTKPLGVPQRSYMRYTDVLYAGKPYLYFTSEFISLSK